MPIVDVIRSSDVLAEFPGRTEADLYLWIVEHLYFLREIERDTSIEEAAEDYAEQYSEKSIKKLVRGFKQAFTDDGEVPLEEVKAQQARQRFLVETRLDQLRPDQTVGCSSDADYDRLLEHIQQHRYYMGLDLKRDVSQDEAVAHWYDEVYMPIVAAIRENNLLGSFSGKTATDLYLSIIAYLDQLRQTAGDVSAETAAIDYAAQFKQHPILKILGGLLTMFAGGESSKDDRIQNPDAASQNPGSHRDASQSEI
jgi:hypothetical protein